MPNLKDLRIRITSVKSTQKITSAMKMVAASKLRRAQSEAELGRPYASRMESMLGKLTANMPTREGAPRLLAGTGADETHLLVVVTSDRGLCGGFNGAIIRNVRSQIIKLQADGKTVKLLCIGRKGRDGLKSQFGSLIIDTMENVTRTGATFESSEGIAERLAGMLDANEFDVCTITYSLFKSAISQVVTPQQLIPIPAGKAKPDDEKNETSGPGAVYFMEPSEEEILADLLPRNLAVQIYRSLLESYASEQGARMSAMDNATRSASDMIDDLTMTYNRTRQAYITKELIEIISGAEAL